MGYILGFAIGATIVALIIIAALRYRGDSTTSITGLSIRKKSVWLFPLVAYIAMVFLSTLVFGWGLKWSFMAGIPLAVATWMVVRRSGSEQSGEATTGFQWKNFSVPFHLWITFHIAFWSLVGVLYDWSYVAKWWYGEWAPFFWAMHIIYVSRGRLPEKMNAKERFAHLATGGMFLFLFWGMLINTGLVVFNQPSLFSHIPESKNGTEYAIPGKHQTYSRELMPGAFSVALEPEGKDPTTGANRKMTVGILPAGTTWIHLYKIEGRVYTDKMVYTFANHRLAVEDGIRVNEYGLPTPDKDGDGYLNADQSPLWLVLADSLGGWRLVHEDRIYLKSPLAEDTPLYVLFKSDQHDPGLGVIHLEIRSGV